jgi:hypothetical protein
MPRRLFHFGAAQNKKQIFSTAVEQKSAKLQPRISGMGKPDAAVPG